MAGGIACLVFGIVVLATLFLSRAGSLSYALILVDANITFFIGASLVSIGTYLTLGLGGRSDDAALGTPYQV